MSEDVGRVAQGPRGPQGIQGIPGETGPSAYDLAVEEGFEGTLEEWLENLVGPQGPPAEAGAEPQVPGPDSGPNSRGHA